MVTTVDIVDIALAFYLVIILPAQQLWQSARRKDAPRRTRTERYLSSIRQIAILLAVLVLACWRGGHTAAQLGLGVPASGAALWCLLIPLLALPLLHLVGKRQEARLDAARLAAQHEKIRSNENMPRTPAEMRVFAVLSVFIGAGWEVLYRGFLMLVLAPWLGTWGAVLVAGIAYGCGHGYHGARQLAASMLMALILTAAYVLSGSLWWLIAIHVALPLMSAASYYKVLAAPSPPAPQSSPIS